MLHGEKGILRTTWEPADILAEKMYRQIITDTDLTSGDEVCVLVNGLGSTTLMELAIVYRKVKRLLDADGIEVYDADLNSYCTSQEMGGFSITLLKLDDELKKYYDMPCQSPYYTRGEVGESECALRHGGISTPEAAEAETALRHGSTDAAEDIMPVLSQIKERERELSYLRSRDAANMLLYIADKIIGQKACLTKIDSAIGDGDHGIGMERGMKSMKAALPGVESRENVYEVFETAGKAMLLSMGGASGVIFGSMFLEGAKEKEPQEILDACDLAVMMRQALSAIQERGKAQIGDKTMVDALAPAVSAMEMSCDRGLAAMLRKAEEAAKEGTERTKLYKAKFGRAKSLQERAIGFQDAGATSVWLIFQGMREFVEGTV